MARSLNEKLAATRRQHILEVAIDLFAEQGFQKTTIKQIARQAGVADGTIYNTFKNKKAILLAIIRQVTAAEVRDIDFAHARQIDFESFARFYVGQRMAEIDGSLPHLRVILSESLVNADLAGDVYEQIYGPAFAVAERYFADLQQNDLLPAAADPQLVARLLASPLLGLLLLRLLGDRHVDENWVKYGQAVAAMLIRGSHVDPVPPHQDKFG